MRIQWIVWSVCSITGLLQANLAAAQWGTIKGQVTVTGTLSELPVLVKKGNSAAKDSSICAAADIPDESRVINAQSNGLANVVIWLIQKPSTIHPDLLQSKAAEVVLHQTGASTFRTSRSCGQTRSSAS
jgi:hypothetical protein